MRVGPVGNRAVHARVPKSFEPVEPDIMWRTEAQCAQSDPETWFGTDKFTKAAARRICYECPVRLQCLMWSLDNPKYARFGIWGGLDEDERRTAIRRRYRQRKGTV